MRTQIIATLALAVFAMAGPTTDSMRSIVPPACSDACSALIDVVGPCAEGLNSDFTFSANSADVAGSFAMSGDFIGLRDCACSQDAFDAAEACLDCVNTEACLGADMQLTIADMQGACDNPMAKYMDLKQRYSPLSPCSSKAGPLKGPKGPKGHSCKFRPQ